MQTLIEPEEIIKRAQIIGLSKKELSHRADVHPSTVNYITKPGVFANTRTISKLARVVRNQEISLRDYLNDLHPKTDPESGD